MTIKSGELMLWSRANGEINLVRVLRPASTGYACEICDRHGTPIAGDTILAGPKQLSQSVRLSELTYRQSEALMAARANVLVFDNLSPGKLICGQLVNANSEWVNVRYKSACYNRKNHNVWLMPGQAVPEFVEELRQAEASPKHFINSMNTCVTATSGEVDILKAAGQERGFILWNPKSTHAPTVVHKTLEAAMDVQRLMAKRHPGEAFHVCPVGPGLLIETVTTTTEKFV